MPAQPAKADPAKTMGATNASVFFLNNQLGWVVVQLESQQPPVSVILHTSDGGQNWVQLNSPGLSVQQLAFTDAQHGWAMLTADAGNNSTHCAIMATLDGGQTWTQQLEKDVQLQDQRLYRIQFLDASNGFALLGDSFAATVDGGADWVQRLMAQGMSSFSFASPLEGWATGANSVWHTADGGSTWTKQWTVPDEFISNFVYSPGIVSFVSPASGWALFQGDSAMFKTTKLILHTDDGGSNWSVTSAYDPPTNPGNPPVNKAPAYTTARFDPVDATTALLAASPPTDYPVLYRTNDSGGSWETLSNGMSSLLACRRATGEISISSTTARAGARSSFKPPLRQATAPLSATYQ